MIKYLIQGFQLNLFSISRHPFIHIDISLIWLLARNNLFMQRFYEYDNFFIYIIQTVKWCSRNYLGRIKLIYYNVSEVWLFNRN